MIKRLSLAIAALAIVAAASSCKNNDKTVVVNTEPPYELSSVEDSLSWALGFTLANTIASTGFSPNREVLFQAICATLDSKPQPMDQETTMRQLMNIQLMQHKRQSDMAQDVQAREAEYFKQLLQDNPQIKTSDKGFYYEVLKEGTGRKGEPGLIAVFDFKGCFANGQIFDQTYGNRDAVTHVIGEPMMPGLIDGMCLMNAGSTYRFYFPSDRAFGQKGNESVPPNTIVIYEVEMHEIKDF